MKQKVWIVGANGAIGFELVKIYLKNGFKVVASSRDIENSKDFLNLKRRPLNIPCQSNSDRRNPITPELKF